MNLWQRINRCESGSAAIETVIVLPYQILVIALILQLAHWMVAYQVVFYASYAAARAALVSEINPDDYDSQGRWNKVLPNVAPAGTAEFWSDAPLKSPQSRPYRAAAHICSMLEFYHSTPAGNFVKLPSGGHFRKDAYEESGRESRMLQVGFVKSKRVGAPNNATAAKDVNADITVGVAYDVLLPVPFANTLFYAYFKMAGAASTKSNRVIIYEEATVCRPWR